MANRCHVANRRFPSDAISQHQHHSTGKGGACHRESRDCEAFSGAAFVTLWSHRGLGGIIHLARPSPSALKQCTMPSHCGVSLLLATLIVLSPFCSSRLLPFRCRSAFNLFLLMVGRNQLVQTWRRLIVDILLGFNAMCCQDTADEVCEDHRMAHERPMGIYGGPMTFAETLLCSVSGSVHQRYHECNACSCGLFVVIRGCISQTP